MILLDTHVTLWWLGIGKRLSEAAATLIDDAPSILVSPLTCWEIGQLEGRGQIALNRPLRRWVAGLFSLERVEPAAMSPEIGVDAALLGAPFPADPIDRLLYATARNLDAAFISADQQIHDFAQAAGDVRVIW